MDEGETARDLGEASKFLQKSGCRVPWAPSLAAPSEAEGPGVLSQGVLRPFSWSDSSMAAQADARGGKDHQLLLQCPLPQLARHLAPFRL